MKTYKNLIEYATSEECFNIALKKAIENKMHRKDVLDVLQNKEEVARSIRRMLLTGEYPTKIHKAVVKKDGPYQKERIIVFPYFTKEYPEQWIQHIVVEALRKIMLKGAYFHSYASLPYKGIHAGKKYLSSYIRKNDVRYFFKADIKKFYNNIDTEILKKRFKKIIKDEKFLKAIYWIIDNNEFQLPDGTVQRMGLPIGAYSSQWFANFFLQDFDHYVKEVLKAPFYIRYMDDIVVLHNNKRELHRIKEGIIAYLKRINLNLKPNYSIQKFDYKRKDGKEVGTFIDFMGFKFYRNRTTIRRAIFYRSTRLARRVHKHIKKYGVLLPKDASGVIAYYGFYKCTNSYKAYMKYISPMVNMRACKRLVHWIKAKAWWTHLKRKAFKKFFESLPAKYIP